MSEDEYFSGIFFNVARHGGASGATEEPRGPRWESTRALNLLEFMVILLELIYLDIFLRLLTNIFLN